MNIRGEHCNPSVMPTIIKEVYFPPDAPMEVATLMESSLVYQNSANYEMAVKSLEMGRDRWRILSIPKNAVDASPVKVGKKDALSAPPVPVALRPEQEMYFELALGSIYESAGKDDIAMSCYMKAIGIKLAPNHPDEAFAYCGLGSVLYNIDEPAWSLRCYLKARQIREERLGGDTVDTAAVYNNLGCNMYYLERN
jgi:tetratricopeptide (TPR) repeat protein